MPEGPEVKSMVIQLNKYLSGKTLKQIIIHSGRYSKKSPDNFTKFIEGYWMPSKFGIDKRKVHLSSLIHSKQIRRDEAINILIMLQAVILI